ncbi:MAG: hypothetical protein KBC81_02295 [Candidatus Pacebacteria bacterium]|nr:hypothetical protein [Candidatus Paceibacterota bacterium]
MALSKNSILRSREFWIGFLVAVVVFVGLIELQKSNNRAAALSDLNSKFSKITSPTARAALVIRDEAIIKANKSWFSFYNSSAMMASPDEEEVDNKCRGNATDWTCNLRNDRELIGSVTGSEDFNLTPTQDENGEWQIGVPTPPCAVSDEGC